VTLQSSKGRRRDAEAMVASKSNFARARQLFDKAAAETTDLVVATLRSKSPSPARLASLDRATHCLDATM
jgi:hypothetical protein